MSSMNRQEQHCYNQGYLEGIGDREELKNETYDQGFEDGYNKALLVRMNKQQKKRQDWGFIVDLLSVISIFVILFVMLFLYYGATN